MKSLFIVLSVLCISHSHAQSFLDGYRVEYRYQAYEQITPDTLFWANELWFDSSYHNQYFPYTLNPAVFKFPLGNEYVYDWDYEIDRFHITLNSTQRQYYLYSRPVNSRTREYSDTPPYQTVVCADLDSSMGAEPVLKFEFRKLGLCDSLYRVKGYLNMQYRFYQNGDIELHYGDCVVPTEVLNARQDGTGNFKPYFQGFTMNPYNIHWIFIAGAYNNPFAYVGTGFDIRTLMRDSALTPFPPEGTVYRLTKTPVGIAPTVKLHDQPEVYPNPTRGIIHLDKLTRPVTRLSIMDLTGKERSIMHVNENNQVDLSGLGKGMYLLKIETDEGIAVKKVWMQ